MTLSLYYPSYPLNGFVESMFFYEGYDPGHDIDKFLPDGNTEIIIELNDNPQHIYELDTLREIQSCRNSWVSGIRTNPICIPSGKNSRMIVVTFKKGRAYPFYKIPLRTLTDQVVDASLIFGKPVVELRERLLQAKNPGAMFALIESFLIQAGSDKLNPSPAAGCVDYAVARIRQAPHSLAMEDLNREIGFSQKHFIQLFKDHVGLTPKGYQRILRFQKAILEIEKQPAPFWDVVVHHCGYYDQAHFIGEFKHYSGLTPQEYMQQKSDLINYIPVK